MSKHRSRATKKVDIYRRYKQIQHLKKSKIARNIICFITNVIIAKQKFQPILFTDPFQIFLLLSENVLKQKFESKNA